MDGVRVLIARAEAAAEFRHAEEAKKKAAASITKAKFDPGFEWSELRERAEKWADSDFGPEKKQAWEDTKFLVLDFIARAEAAAEARCAEEVARLRLDLKCRDMLIGTMREGAREMSAAVDSLQRRLIDQMR